MKAASNDTYLPVTVKTFPGVGKSYAPIENLDWKMGTSHMFPLYTVGGLTSLCRVTAREG